MNNSPYMTVRQMSKFRVDCSYSLVAFQKYIYFLILSALCLTGNCAAQSDVPLAPEPQSLPFPLAPAVPQPLPTPAPTPQTPLDIAPTSPQTSDDLTNIPGEITVKQFTFKGNTVFNDQELSEITEAYLNRPITFAALLAVESAITQHYTEAGYINSGAVIPAGQSLSPDAAVITIKIIEGALETINVTIDGRLNPNYVRSRLAIATEKPLNQQRLLEALQLLQLNPLIDTITAELSAGSSPELAILTVKVIEADTFSVEAFADNGRVESIGSFERGIRLNQLNLLGVGDGLSIEYANTDGSNAVYTDYTVPINPYNGTVKFSSRLNLTQVIEPPFDRLDITGDSLYLDLTLRQPLIQTPSEEFTVGITGSRAQSKTTLLGEGFPLSPGANDEGETRIWALRLFQEWTQRGAQDVLSLRSQFSFGLDAFDASINETQPDGSFFEWQGQGQYVRSLAPDTLLVLRSSVQLANQPLLSLEQFTLGGLFSVRGYRQNLLLTDNGVFGSAEVRLPLLRVNEIDGLLQIVPFVDFGVGWNHQDNLIPTPNPNTLISLGLGLNWQMQNNFSARLDWGIPLTDFEIQGNTVPEQELYFTINYRFF